MNILKGQLEDDPRGTFILGWSPGKRAQVRDGPLGPSFSADVGVSGGGSVGGPSAPSPAIRPAVPHHRAPPLRPPLRARLFRARAALRLAPPSPPPALRVCARRCGFFSGLRGAPLLAPALAGTRLLSTSLSRVELWPAAETPQAAPPVSNPSRRGSCPGNPCPVAVPGPPLRPSCRPTPEPGGG
ncbi:hypothetical protein J1605_010550 [Eschrichtius robustus]|uniref:Uncharacterized protein n=1 Tax=Eschrichtius robustus TaxID=9764 RepID=A0AB34GS81_ESCRO|nr:hypothetical protein J1605_010550 [Eschrichtius robustus]